MDGVPDLGARAFFALAVALVVAVLALRWAGGLLGAGRTRRTLERWVVPALELLVVVATALWLVAAAASGLPVSGLVALGAVLLAFGWAARAVLDDFVSGIALRMEGLLETDRWVRLAGVEGVVRSVGYRAVTIETPDGKRVSTPFGMIARQTVVTIAAGPRAHSFSLEVPKGRPLARVLAEVPSAALLSPWASTTRLPRVVLLSETESHYVLDVTAYSIDPAYNSQLEIAVRERLG